MKTFVQKAQQLGKQAAALRQAAMKAPGQAAELREIVAMTASELHQIRSEVQANINGLRSNTEDSLVAAMREIDQSSGTFAAAGYELAGLDLDLALNQRLTVHLDRVVEVAATDQRKLLARETSPSTKSILAAIIKAEEVAASVELQDLDFGGLLVHIGPVPAIRMCWRPPVDIPAAAPTELPPIVHPEPPPLPGAMQVTTIFEEPARAASQSFAQARTSPVTSKPIEEEPSQTAPPPPAATPHFDTHRSERKEVAWTSAALDRFKKMPSGSKYDR